MPTGTAAVFSATNFLPPPRYPPPATSKTKPTSCHVIPRMSLNQSPSSGPKSSTSSSSSSLLSSITNLLWGPSLPPGLLVATVRTAWETTWQLMMSQLAPSDTSGGYSRPLSQFRATKISANNLHLYVGLPCPWAHRTLIVRALKGLENAVPVSVAGPGADGSWEFRENPTADNETLRQGLDRANGCKTLKEVYRLRGGGYNGRSTVPMLWDAEKKEVICNESSDIIEILNSGLNGLAENPDLDLSPPLLKGKIEEWNAIVYPNVNNGVYRCGFAQSQEAYDKAVNGLFSTLDVLDDHLGRSRYLCGENLTLADVCLFTTLIRFDLVYNVLFKCTKKKLLEYANLHGYMRDIYQIPKVAATCNFTAIMDGYYKTLFPLNPGNIRPTKPASCYHEALLVPSKRGSLPFLDTTKQFSVLSPQL
ncbi:uncharacterized protein LOC111463882 isoform X3 [Cucurbita moschata]|uniref:Uncharacterized protein LOC111463882 isoform X3 n=1 Tax=Cucurbita moschata TaxID=3662 RepID=A0A6J1HFN3_CUCMO|nr:uncharacterized protein LOC111463882 isoform X3 [Cucurbita moschata]